jgi:hypothetical protein
MKGKMKFILKSIIAILFISNCSFAQIASFDIAVTSTAKTGSTWVTSMDEKDKKPNVDNAATHSNPVISGIKNHLYSTAIGFVQTRPVSTSSANRSCLRKCTKPITVEYNINREL